MSFKSEIDAHIDRLTEMVFGSESDMESECCDSDISIGDERKTVLILFLAHDGVTQPTLWERWRELTPDLDVRFLVHCPAKCKVEEEFCKVHALPLEMGPTKWGFPSIAAETVRCLAYVRSTFSAVDDYTLFLVSGDSIPLVHPTVLLQADSSIRLCSNGIRHSQFFTVTKDLLEEVQEGLLNLEGFDEYVRDYWKSSKFDVMDERVMDYLQLTGKALTYPLTVGCVPGPQRNGSARNFTSLDEPFLCYQGRWLKNTLRCHLVQLIKRNFTAGQYLIPPVLFYRKFSRSVELTGMFDILYLTQDIEDFPNTPDPEVVRHVDAATLEQNSDAMLVTKTKRLVEMVSAHYGDLVVDVTAENYNISGRTLSGHIHVCAFCQKEGRLQLVGNEKLLDTALPTAKSRIGINTGATATILATPFLTLS